MDAVQQANSGHPGAPMGMAEIAVALWGRHLRHNPADPQWPDRDRFVLSNGHGSMLLYALLHLTGYDLPISELRNFRQLHSKTPGHPEVGLTPGVETTTGPLGQGLANAVGMALAEKLLAREFNRAGHAIVDHHTYVFLGDGCLMEGISHEACALAGAWRLEQADRALRRQRHLDRRRRSRRWFVDDTPKRFEAYGWNVIGADRRPRRRRGRRGDRRGQASDRPADADRLQDDHRQGLAEPRRHRARRTASRSAPTRVAATRDALGWPHEPFVVPEAAYDALGRRDARRGARGGLERRASRCTRRRIPSSAAEFVRRMTGELPHGFAQRAAATRWPRPHAKAEAVATRKASQLALEAFTPALPEMLGGSADLTGSNLTNTSEHAAAAFRRRRRGRNGGRHINYGVREFGMAAVMNGIALHGGYIPYGGTFLTFSDYSRNAIRMAALMKQRVIHVFTHDSIGLGEDGPTHQAVEHAASLRLIPGLDVWRPADAAETAVAWAVRAREPRSGRPRCCCRARTCRTCRRRELDEIAQGRLRAGRAGRGRRCAGSAQAVIIAHRLRSAAGAARAGAARAGTASRCASCRCRSTTVFDRQSVAYKNERAARRACRASRSRRASPTAGGSTAAPRWSASTASANRRRPACCSSISASPRKTSRRRCASCSAAEQCGDEHPSFTSHRGTP